MGTPEPAAALVVVPGFWIRALLASREHSGSKVVGVAVATQFIDATGRGAPGANAVAAAVGLSTRIVRDHLGRLADNGWLALVHQGGLRGQPAGPNVYRLAVPPAASVVAGSA